MFRSGPTAIPSGWLFALGMLNSVIVPPVVMRPILFAKSSTNHMAPSGPAVMTSGWLPAARRNSVKVPAGVSRPTLSPFASVNHRLPSGPVAMPFGLLLGVGTGKDETAPAVVMRPIELAAEFVNQSASSGPAAMWITMSRPVGGDEMLNSWNDPGGWGKFVDTIT